MADDEDSVYFCVVAQIVTVKMAIHHKFFEYS